MKVMIIYLTYVYIYIYVNIYIYRICIAPRCHHTGIPQSHVDSWCHTAGAGTGQINRSLAIEFIKHI